MSQQNAKNSEKDRKQELYVELKQLDEEVKALNSQLEKVDDQLADLNASMNILNKFTELKEGSEIRVPLTSGIYIKAGLKDTKNVLINVGADVSVEKKPEEVLKILEGQIGELTAYRISMIDNMKKIIARIEEIQKEFE